MLHPGGVLRLRILMLCPYFFPEKNAAAVRAMAFAKYFVREGAEVHIITPESDRIPADAAFPGVSVIRVRSYDSLRERRSFLQSLPCFPRAVRRMRAAIEAIRPDVVLTTTPSPFLAFEGHMACRPLKIPVVFDVRDTWLLLSLNHPGVLNNFIKRRIEGQCCWGAKKVLVVTSTLGDQLVQDHDLPRDRIVMAPNGADLEIFNVSSDPDVDIVFLGSPSTYRKLEQVFEALSILLKRRPSTTMRYIGWGDTEYTRRLMSIADSLGVTRRIEFLPPIPHAEVPAALARARIGLISVSSEPEMRVAVGAKTYEYMAAGLPLAFFGPPSDCELRRLWQSTQAGIYESEPEKLAESLGRVLDDEDLRQSLAEKARKASAIFDRKAIAQMVYRNVLLPIAQAGR
jgi:colanic acid biosynthesis glycosyl transferase WcaI